MLLIIIKAMIAFWAASVVALVAAAIGWERGNEEGFRDGYKTGLSEAAFRSRAPFNNHCDH